MLKLYYTTTKGEAELQPKFNRSLGGYKSDSPVKNDDFDNFFSEVSNYTISQNNQNEYIGLIMKNEGSLKTNILVYFDYPDNCYSKIYMAAVDLNIDEEGAGFMENIPTIHSSPVYAEFHEAEGVGNAVNIGDLEQGEMVGLWFKREILVNVAKGDYEDIVEPDPSNIKIMVQKKRETSDTIGICFNYN